MRVKYHSEHFELQKLTQQRQNKESSEDQQLKQKFAMLKHFAQAMKKLKKNTKKVELQCHLNAMCNKSI